MLFHSAKHTISITRTLLFMGAVTGAFIGIVYANELLDPAMLLQQIKTKGAESVYKYELTGKKWLMLIKNVETGKKLWLEVAAAIYPATDAGPAEDLTLAAGEALIRSPREVLLLAAPKMGIEGVCDYSEMTMEHRKVLTPKQAIIDIDARIKIIQKLTGPDIAEQRDQCVRYLEKAKYKLIREEK